MGIRFEEVERLARAESPDLVEAIHALLDEDPVRDENAPEPQNPYELRELLRFLRDARRLHRDENERTLKIQEAWTRFLSQGDDVVPPRFKLAGLLVSLYERNTEAARAALLELIAGAPLKFGLWAGIKRIYKLAEERLDAEMFGAIAARVDNAWARESGEVSKGTTLYLRRRAWRFLRGLGRAGSSLYVDCAVHTLRRYEDSSAFGRLWIASHVYFHETKQFDAWTFVGSADKNELVAKRAYDALWRASSAPLTFLLETASSDHAARFAIQSLKRDFPDVLRQASAPWLARLAARPLEGVHDFVVETIKANPGLAAAKLREAGLHETVLSLLKSPSDDARAYAIEYARGYARDLSSERLVAIALDDDYQDDARTLADEMLMARPARDAGVTLLGRALDREELKEWASKALSESFDRKEISEAFLREMIFGSDEQREWAKEWIGAKFQPGEMPVAFWKSLIEDKRSEDEYDAGDFALDHLKEVPLATIGATWIFAHLDHGYWGDTLGELLTAATEAVPDLDVEKIKGLVFDRSKRRFALDVLNNVALVKPRDVGLGWLLALARRDDSQLHDFAHRYLRTNMAPDDFGDEKTPGTERLFALATGKKEPDPVRDFAQSYLLLHHPVIGPEHPETKELRIEPKLTREDYTAARVWPSLFDARQDVRKFAVAITRVEMRRWGKHRDVYELAGADAKEVRNLAFDALLKAGDPMADPARTLTVDELDAARIFAMTESRIRSARELAMELIRRHYKRLGGADRLAWLMQSADRAVRMLAVRLLWERHRPRGIPETWKPRGGGGGGAAPAPEGSGEPDAGAATQIVAAPEDDEVTEDEEVRLAADGGEEESSDESASDEESDEESGDDEDSGDDESEDESDDEDSDDDESEDESEDEDSDDEDSDDEESEDESDDDSDDEDSDDEDSDEDESDDEDSDEDESDDESDEDESEDEESEDDDESDDEESQEDESEDDESGDDDEASEEPAAVAAGVAAANEAFTGIQCPKCAWVPLKASRWACSCGNVWNTFDTRGRCPTCNKQWEDTACLSCRTMSPHESWYAVESVIEAAAPAKPPAVPSVGVIPAPSEIAKPKLKRPAPPPIDYDPTGGAGPFRDSAALRDFLRRVLFALPPGRSMEQSDDARARRRLPSSVAKRNAIEVVRDLAVEDVTFAKMVAPLLEEFAGSIAKGEWQACLSAVAWIRRAHPAAFGITPSAPVKRESKRALGRRKAAAARKAGTS